MTVYNAKALVFGDKQTVGTVTIPVNETPQSATAVATATSGTIATASLKVSRVSPTAAVTGVILAVGTYDGQDVWVVNEATAANTVTFAASGTSNVAAGTAAVIAGAAASHFIWSSGTLLWYKAA